MEQSKPCSKCRQIKSLTAFHNDSKSKDGRAYQCMVCRRESQRIHGLLNREAKNAKAALYRANNKAVIAARKSQAQKNNPEYFAYYVHKRRANRIAGGTWKITAKEIRLLLSKPCFYCQKYNARMTMDHVVPISKGGRHSIGNLISACNSCNASKGNKLMIEYLIYRKRVAHDAAGGQGDSVGIAQGTKGIAQ